MNIKIDVNSLAPLHYQIESGIREYIQTQRCQPGDFLFTEVGLCKECGISRDPVRQAVTKLVMGGLLERRRAKGVFMAQNSCSGLITGRQLSLVAPDLRHSFYGSMMSGCIAQAKKHGYELNISCSEFSSDRECSILRQIASMKPHVAIVCTNGGESCRAALEELLDRGFGIVMLDRHFPSLRCDYVENDNLAIGRDAVNYLIKLGHRRILHATMNDESDINTPQRRQGYVEAMEAAGLNPQLYDVLAPGESWMEDCERRTANWLKQQRGPLPTAIFAVNDTVCVGIMRATLKAGLRIPDDISLLGCADLDIAQAFLEPLSTIDQFSYDMGARAVTLAIRRFENGLTAPACAQEIQRHRIVERRTTTAPRKFVAALEATGKC